MRAPRNSQKSEVRSQKSEDGGNYALGQESLTSDLCPLTSDSEAWLSGWNKGWDAALADEKAEIAELHRRLYAAHWELDHVREAAGRLAHRAMRPAVGETCWLVLAATALALLAAIFWGARP